MPDLREYTLRAASTETFGRVLLSAGKHHFIVDGPVQNGCPGEEITPAEAFLAGVAACGIELVQVIARDRGIPVGRVGVQIEGRYDRDHPVRPDLMVFNSVRMSFEMDDVAEGDARALVEAFKGR